jgi:hypothetical protein
MYLTTAAITVILTSIRELTKEREASSFYRVRVGPHASAKTRRTPLYPAVVELVRSTVPTLQ